MERPFEVIEREVAQRDALDVEEADGVGRDVDPPSPIEDGSGVRPYRRLVAWICSTKRPLAVELSNCSVRLRNWTPE